MIEVKNLTKKFNGKRVLNDVSFEVGKGEVFGYLGPNGAGKTTTMRIFLGLLKPTSGKALVMGRNLDNDEEVRGRVGVVLENDGLYERLSAYANLDYYAQLYDVSSRKDKIKELLQFVGLYERKDDKVGEFSRGMRRKLALVRSIIHEPDILFFDEPSAGLDPEAQKMVRDLILELSKEKGRTIFLNSHDLDEVQRICTRIAILQNGKIKACDTVENLRKRFSKPIVMVSTVNERDTQRALDIINSLDFVSDCKRENKRITVTLKEKSSSSLLNVLMEEGIEVEEIKKVEKSLEDVYLDIMHQEEREK